MKKLLLFTALLFSFVGFAQDLDNNEAAIDSLETKIKRLSVGVKVGIPNVISLSGEYTTPLLNNRIAPYIDFSQFDVNDDETEIGLGYNEFGVNIYLGDQGKGLYAALGAGNLSTDLTFYEDLDNGGRGKGTTSLDIKSTNLKLGVKTGGRIYFRFEFGYGFTSDIPEDITITLREIDGSNTEVDVFEFPTIPGVGTQGILIGNFGFGVSF